MPTLLLLQGAIEYVKSTISDLLMNRMDLSLLVITKSLSQEARPFPISIPYPNTTLTLDNSHS